MQRYRVFILVVAGALVGTLPAHAQDSQSLGDVARQARLQKQKKDAQAKEAAVKAAPGRDAPAPDGAAKDAQPAKTPRVITNEEIPEHVGPTTSDKSFRTSSTPYPEPSSRGGSDAGEQWKAQFLSQKAAIAALQAEIANVSESIHYAGANCVANCVQWNERQKQKQDQVESMKAQLAEQQKRLEDMQESARKQGFGSSVYDP